MKKAIRKKHDGIFMNKRLCSCNEGLLHRPANSKRIATLTLGLKKYQITKNFVRILTTYYPTFVSLPGELCLLSWDKTDRFSLNTIQIYRLDKTSKQMRKQKYDKINVNLKNLMQNGEKKRFFLKVYFLY